jgi:hypothetical protein
MAGLDPAIHVSVNHGGVMPPATRLLGAPWEHDAVIPAKAGIQSFVALPLDSRSRYAGKFTQPAYTWLRASGMTQARVILGAHRCADKQLLRASAFSESASHFSG